MDETTFLHLFATYQVDTRAPILMPEDETAREKIFSEMKKSIVELLHVGDTNPAEQVVSFAEALADQRGGPEDQAWADWCRGLCYMHREARRACTAFKAAADFYRQAGRYEEEARALIGYGGLLGQLGELEEAERVMRYCMVQLASRPDYVSWPAIYINLADIQGRQGKYEAMLISAQAAETKAITLNNTSYQVAAIINQGVAALYSSQLELAEETFHKAQALLKNDASAELSARILVNLGCLATAQGNLFAGLRLFDQASGAFWQAGIPIEQAEVDKLRVPLFEQLYMLREAHQAAQQSAEQFEKAGLSLESFQAHMMTAGLALHSGHRSKAASALKEAERLLDHVSPIQQAFWEGCCQHWLVSPSQEPQYSLAKADVVVTELGDWAAIQEQLQIALIGAHWAATLSQADSERRYTQIIEMARDRGLRTLEQEALVALARQLKPKAAYQKLRCAADIVANMRQQMPIEEVKATLLTGNLAVYRELIEVQIKSRQPVAAAQTLLEAKGGIWVDLAGPTQPHLPDLVWLQAKTKLHQLRTESRSTDDAEIVAQRHEEIRQTEVEIEAAARRQVRRRPPGKLPAVTEVQANLPPSTIVVEYFLSADHRFLWACIIAAVQQPRWVRLKKLATLRNLLDQFHLMIGGLQVQRPALRQQMARLDQPYFDSLVGQIYDLLLAPLQEHIPSSAHLVIVPDDFLFAVPWSALRTETCYLSEQHEISLVPSSAIFALEDVSAPSPTLAAPLVLGHAGQPPLAHIQEELTSIQDIVPDARCLNPTQLKDMVWQTPPRFLHIAAHGYMNRETPLLSQIELADGAFLLADALNLPLHGTEWVTLSACDTGTTPARGGVALALSGAFLVAGAKIVLASLWPVDDKSTHLLMTHLYTHLEQKCSFGKALQMAQQAVRQSGYAHPYYWAAFQPLSRHPEAA